MEQAWNTLEQHLFHIFWASICEHKPMEQVEQAQPTSMKIYNIFMTALCFKNVLQKALC